MSANIGVEDVTLTALTDNVFGDLNGLGSCSTPQTILVGGTTPLAPDTTELPWTGPRAVVVLTPGHAPGHVVIHGHGVAFVGDCLFAGSVGRVDFPGGALLPDRRLTVFTGQPDPGDASPRRRDSTWLRTPALILGQGPPRPTSTTTSPDGGVSPDHETTAPEAGNT